MSSYRIGFPSSAEVTTYLAQVTEDQQSATPDSIAEAVAYFCQVLVIGDGGLLMLGKAGALSGNRSSVPDSPPFEGGVAAPQAQTGW